jgi:cholest-4-en-3-one 26-monooxygenase
VNPHANVPADTRSPNDHIAFGGRGPHFCLGSGLARLELQVMLDEVLNRMPDISSAGEPELSASNFMRGIERMPVRFTPGPRRGLSAAPRDAAGACACATRPLRP